MQRLYIGCNYFASLVLDADVAIEAKRPRLSSYEPEEVKSVDVQLGDPSRAKLGSILEQSEKSALPSAISLDKIEVKFPYYFLCFTV